MDYLPLFARLNGQPCLVVGGGEVANRKVQLLLEAGARVVVNAHDLVPALARLATAGRIRHVPGPFNPAYAGEAVLVIAATDSHEVNAAVAAAARTSGRFCNVVDDAEHSSAILPAVVDRSPVIVAVSSGGLAPVLARRLRQYLEALLPARLGRLALWAGRWREPLKKAIPGIERRRRTWESLLGGEAAAAVLGGDETRADTLAAAAADGPGPAGHAWLVGAGPGDPGLISVRGLQALREADVVLHDRLVAPELLQAVRREALLIDVGKAGHGGSTAQADINEQLVAQVRAGRRVCRLKGGDPLIFGRGGEEALALARAGLSFEVVPGITAASGCAAAAGIPLTHRGLSSAVTFVTASAAPGQRQPDWSRHASAGATLVVYMGGAQAAAIAAALVAAGRDPATPAAVIVDGTRPTARQHLTNLAELAAAGMDHDGRRPALLIVGETVALAAELVPTAEEPFTLAAVPRARGEWPESAPAPGAR
ncbi:MAG: uroporphyrinogen-III C-methyltransferase [Gammaproteobacteria bacterium]|nr:uroporphyrinogen-III C-methyltransferase [Gammaproteobacteria bacterium]